MITLESHENIEAIRHKLTAWVIWGDNVTMATNTTKVSNRPKSKGRAQPVGIKRNRVQTWITPKCSEDLDQLMAQLVVNLRDGGSKSQVLEALVEKELLNQRKYAQQVAASLMKAAKRANIQS